jgi:hypothetical protein
MAIIIDSGISIGGGAGGNAGQNGAGGGGTEVLGQGTDGLGGAGGGTADGTGGGNGSSASNETRGVLAPGGPYGGGAPGADLTTPIIGAGSGAARIIWGAARAFPNTNTGNL